MSLLAAKAALTTRAALLLAPNSLGVTVQVLFLHDRSIARFSCGPIAVLTASSASAWVMPPTGIPAIVPPGRMRPS